MQFYTVHVQLNKTNEHNCNPLFNLPANQSKLQQPDSEAQKVPCTGISQFHSVVSPACFRLPVRETNKRNRQVSLELTKKTGP